MTAYFLFWIFLEAIGIIGNNCSDFALFLWFILWFNSNSELVDKTTTGITMTITSRALPSSRITISSNDLTVYNQA